MHVPTWFGGTIYGYEPMTTIRCINSYCNLHKLFNWEGGKGRIFRREQLYLVCIKLMDMEETNLVCVRARVCREQKRAISTGHSTARQRAISTGHMTCFVLVEATEVPVAATGTKCATHLVPAATMCVHSVLERTKKR